MGKLALQVLKIQSNLRVQHDAPLFCQCRPACDVGFHVGAECFRRHRKQIDSFCREFFFEVRLGQDFAQGFIDLLDYGGRHIGRTDDAIPLLRVKTFEACFFERWHIFEL